VIIRRRHRLYKIKISRRAHIRGTLHMSDNVYVQPGPTRLRVHARRSASDRTPLPTVVIGPIAGRRWPPWAYLTSDVATWAVHQSSQMILPSGVRLTSNHPKPNDAATASIPTNTALTSGGTSNDRPAISRLRRTGTCSMKAA
jgi:hypothetical protein